MRDFKRLSEMRSAYATHRARFLDSHNDGVLTEVTASIARQQSLPISLVVKYLQIQNRMVAEFLRDYRDSEGERLQTINPNSDSKRDFVVKACVDSRAIFQSPPFLALNLGIERTAGAGVRDGHAFKQLARQGMGLIITHQFCGAEAAAHSFHCSGSTAVDPNIGRILDAIPKAVAIHTDPILRSRYNSVIQSVNASSIVALEAQKNGAQVSTLPRVYPSMISFTPEPKFELIDPVSPSFNLDGVSHPFLQQVGESVLWLHEEATALGRRMDTQYAHTVVLYDSTRVRDPRVLFASLSNENFSVTANFDSLIEKAALRGPHAKSASIGSVEYAISNSNQGHVAGVGKTDGNRFLLIVDTDPHMAQKIKDLLLSNGNQSLRELTKNGETIKIATYDPDTNLIHFQE